VSLPAGGKGVTWAGSPCPPRVSASVSFAPEATWRIDNSSREVLQATLQLRLTGAALYSCTAYGTAGSPCPSTVVPSSISEMAGLMQDRAGIVEGYGFRRVPCATGSAPLALG
jgi:hypothetical protein